MSDCGKTFNIPLANCQDNMYTVVLWKWRCDAESNAGITLKSLQDWWVGVYKGLQKNKNKTPE
eukprot:15339310-Ditylum_brightwellii.AAC.1